jgi:3-oxoacyl-[acyl-carrier protein] reductase
MPGRLQNKTAIITGAGSGFGAGIAKKFVEEGANVLVWDIDPSTPSKVSNELDSSGQQTLAFTGDVSNARDWDRALKEVLGKWDGLDVVVNNAGVVYSSMPSILVC